LDFYVLSLGVSAVWNVDAADESVLKFEVFIIVNGGAGEPVD